MSRIIAAVLVSFILISALASCGKTNEASDNTPSNVDNNKQVENKESEINDDISKKDDEPVIIDFGNTYWVAYKITKDGESSNLPNEEKGYELMLYRNGEYRFREYNSGEMIGSYSYPLGAKELGITEWKFENDSIFVSFFDEETNELYSSATFEYKNEHLFLNYDNGIIEFKKGINIPTETNAGTDMIKLIGTWEAVSSEIEDSVTIAGKNTFTSLIEIYQCDGGYYIDYEYNNQGNDKTSFSNAVLSAENEPLYYGCLNEYWSAKVITDESLNYSVTSVDNDTILVQISFTSDDYSFVSYQKYKRLSDN